MADESEIRIGDGLSAEEKRIQREGIPILAVHYDPKSRKFMFFGYAALTTLLKNGIGVEEYLRAKLENIRKSIIGVH